MEPRGHYVQRALNERKGPWHICTCPHCGEQDAVPISNLTSYRKTLKVECTTCEKNYYLATLQYKSLAHHPQLRRAKIKRFR